MSNRQSCIISAIVAMTEQNVIAYQNHMPWHLPGDLKHFKQLTTGHPVIMGRRTYASIGKPLPHRANIIITRSKAFFVPGCLMVHSITDAIEQAKKIALREGKSEIFVIGGEEIYQQTRAIWQRMYVTIVHHDFEGDTFFPPIDAASWRETKRIAHEADERNAVPYTFITLDRTTD